MKKNMFIVCMFLFLLTISCATSQHINSPTSIAELQTIEKGTIYYSSSNPFDFIDILDRPNSPPQVVFGKLIIPENTTGKVPAIIYMHGSTLSSKNYQWLTLINKLGIATFEINSFYPRGVEETADLLDVTGPMLVADIYNALRILSLHPRIDKNRIGVMGSCMGAGASLFCSWEPIRKALTPDLKLACHISIYAPCNAFDKPEMTGAPILLMHGELDTVCYTKRCVDLAHELKSLGYDIRMRVYKGAYHSFDASYEVARRYDSHWPNSTNCEFRISSTGVNYEVNSGINLSNPENKRKAMKCLNYKNGAITGRDWNAIGAAKKDLTAFLKEVLKL